jgi:PIN domain nuclease of toxin-antitoxin system
MKLLLDTHILVWSRSASKRLSGRLARALNDSRNERWVSPASFWEILTLARKGRLKLDREPHAWITETLERSLAHEASFTNEVALAMDSFRLPHSDPIDAILVATAKVYGLTLVTADGNLIAAKACPILSNL